jgi:hypothetical protein
LVMDLASLEVKKRLRVRFRPSATFGSSKCTVPVAGLIIAVTADAPPECARIDVLPQSGEADAIRWHTRVFARAGCGFHVRQEHELQSLLEGDSRVERARIGRRAEAFPLLP